MAKKNSKAKAKQRQQNKAKKVARKKKRQKSQKPSVYGGLSSDERLYGMEGSVTPFEEFSELVFDSMNLADEPEFADFYIDPMQCVTAMADAMDAAEGEMEQFDDLPDGEQEDTLFNLLDDAIIQVLRNREVRDDIRTRIAALYKRTRNQRGQIALQVSAIHALLEEDKQGESWGMVGLIRALFAQSMNAGIALANTLSDDPLQILTDPKKKAEIAALLENHSELRQYANKEMNTIYEQGLTGLFNGEWQLNLFTLDEIAEIRELIREVFPADEPEVDEAEEARITMERGPSLIAKIEQYLHGLLTPERRKQMQAHLTAFAKEEPNRQSLFADILRADLTDDTNMDYLIPALTKIAFAEARYTEIEITGDEDPDTDN